MAAVAVAHGNCRDRPDTFALFGQESWVPLRTRNDSPDLLTFPCETAEAVLLVPISHTVWLVLKGHSSFKLSCFSLWIWGGGVKPLLAKQSRERVGGIHGMQIIHTKDYVPAYTLNLCGFTFNTRRPMSALMEYCERLEINMLWHVTGPSFTLRTLRVMQQDKCERLRRSEFRWPCAGWWI